MTRFFSLLFGVLFLAASAVIGLLSIAVLLPLAVTGFAAFCIAGGLFIAGLFLLDQSEPVERLAAKFAEGRAAAKARGESQ